MTPNSSTPTAKPIPIIVTSSSTESSDGSDSSSSNSQLLLPDSSSPLFKKLSPSSDISIISTSPNSKLASTLTSPAKLNAIEQPIWVPAHLHPELHPNDFKKWVSTHWQDSTEDNYGYRFSDGKLAFVNHLKNKKPALKRTSSFADRHMVVTADNVGEWVQSQQDSPSTLSDLAAISAATTVEYTKDQHACSSPPNYMMAKRSPSSSSTTSTSSNGGGLNNALQAPLRRSRNIRGRKSSTLSSSLESGGNGDRHHRKSLGPISRKSSDGGAGSGGVTVATSLPTVASTSASTSTSVGVVGVGRGRRPTLKLGLPNYPDHATVNKTSYAAVAAAGAAADDIMRDITIPISPSLGDEAVVVDDELMPQQYRNEVVIDGTEAKRVSSSSAVLIKRPSTSSSSPSSSSAAAIETPRMAKAFSYENTPVSPTNSRRQQQDVPVLLNSSDRILHADDEDEEMTGGSVTMEENRLAKSLVEIEEVVATTAITTSPIEIESIETPVSVVAAAAETAATSKVVVQPPTSTTTTTTTPSVADVNEGTDGSSESSSSEDEEDIDLQGGKKAAKRGKKRDGKNASLETSLPTAAGGKKKGWSWFVGLFDSNSSKTEGDEAFQQLSVNATTTSAAAACAASSSTSLTKSASLSDGRPISSYDDDFEEGMAYPPDTLEVGPGRLPLNLEKAVYKASHEKLAQIRRPLHHQVMISNLMLYIISVHADVTLNRNGPRGLRKGGRRGRRRKSMGGGGVGGGGGSSSMKAMHRNHGLMTAGGGGGTRGYGEFPMDRAMLMNGAAVVSASTVLAANPSSPAAGYHNSMRPASPPGSHQRLPAPHLAAPLAFQSTTSLPHHSLMSAQLGAASTTSSSLMASQTSTTPPFSAYLHQQQQHQYQQHSQQSSSSFYMQQQEKTASSVSLPILNSASINKPHAEDDDDEVPLGVLQMSKRGSIVSI